MTSEIEIEAADVADLPAAELPLMTQGQWAAAVVLLLVATVCVFFPLVRRPAEMLVGVQNGGNNDATAYFAAARGMTATVSDRDGQWPWWNPNLLCGAPVLGNPQSALFYPPNWVFIVWRSPAAVGWMMVFHHLLAGWGTFLLCRKYEFAWLPAVVGAVCFIGAPYFVAHTGEGHFNQTCAVAWLPWAFLAYERFRAGLRGGVALVALTLALSLLCGHAQETYFTGLILSSFVLVDCVGLVRRKETRLAWRRLGMWCGVAAASIGLAAYELLPIWNYSRLSVRSAGMTMEKASEVSLGFSHLWQLVNPAVHGGDGGGRFYWETLCHFGMVPLLLAMAAVVLAWKQYPTRRMAAVWLVTLLFAFGTTLPVFPLLYRLVPGLSLFRLPSRSLFFSSFAVAVLAAGGTNAIWNLRLVASKRVNVVRVACFAGIAISAVLILLQLSGVLPTTVADSWRGALGGNVSRWGLALTGSVLLLIAVRRADYRRVIVGCLLLTCLLDVTSYSLKILRVRSVTLLAKQNPIGEYLVQQAGLFRVMAVQDHWSDYAAIQQGVPKVQGYEPVPLATYATAFDALTPGQDPMNVLVGFVRFDPRTLDREMLDLMGVKYLVAATSREVQLDGWKRVKSVAVPSARDSKRKYVLSLYANPDVMPRAFVVGQARELDPSGRGGVQTLQELDPRKEVLLERDVLRDVPRAEFAPAEIVKYTANEVSVEVTNAKAGYLFLSDVWYPGWSAEVDGEPAEVLRANLAFRAVALTPGTHRVTFRYQPRGMLLGLMIALLTAGLLVAGVMPSASQAASNEGDG